MANNVSKKESTALSADVDFDFEQYAGAGLQNVSSTELATPYFRLLQALSPETKRTDPAYIPGASEGMWCDVVGRAVYDSILFVPVNYVTTFMEWKPRSAGGGLVANHGTDRRAAMSVSQRDPVTKRMMTAAGNEMVETHNWYGIVVSGKIGGEEVPIAKEAVIALSGTQSKTNRKWLTFAYSQKLTGADGAPFTAPVFAVAYRLSSIPDKNEQGSWALTAFAPECWTKELPNFAALKPQIVDFLKQSEKMIADAAEVAAEFTSSGPAPVADDGIPF